MRKHYPRGVRLLVDYDYADRLSPKDRAYLEKFTGEFYNGEFGEKPLHIDADARKAIHKVKHYRVLDIYARGYQSNSGHNADLLGSEEATDLDVDSDPPPPSTPEYKKALARFRSLLPSDGRKNVVESPEFLAARAKIDAVARVITSRRGGDMSKNRVERLLKNRKVIFHLGCVVASHSFRGDEAESAHEMLKWLESMLLKFDDKLKATGYDVSSLPGGAPNGASKVGA